MTHLIAATNLKLFFGHFHPLVIHLPIGFLAALVVLELADRIHHLKHAAQARGLILGLTALSAILAVVLGLMLASAGGYDSHLLAWHKWMGIALAASCVLTAIAYWTKHHRPYVGMLMVTLLILTPAAHFGGSMTHGTDYLTEYAPNWVRSLAGEKSTVTVVKAAKPKITDLNQAQVFADVVQPILQQNCASCHGPDKRKGDLRLDTIAGIQKGGEGGAALVAGKSANSEMIQRMLLPLEDDDHMPPAGKPQPTEDQVAMLQWWIDSGAQADKKVVDLNPPPAVVDAISSQLGIAAPAGPNAAPIPLDQLSADITALGDIPGLIILPLGPKQPFLSVNAANAHPFGDAQLARLAPLAPNIKSLNLAFTKVTDAGLAPIAKMPNLERLRLERTSISDAGIKSLAGLRHLSYLNLYATNVTDDALPILKSLPALRQLYVWQTKVTPAAATAFAEGKVDQNKIDRLKKQIALLQSQIQGQKIEVVEGLPGVAPTTKPAVAAASKPSTSAAVSAAVAINKVCPVTGKPIDPTHFVEYKGKRVAFCCPDCPAIFQKNPEKYAGKVLAAAK